MSLCRWTSCFFKWTSIRLISWSCWSLWHYHSPYNIYFLKQTTQALSCVSCIIVFAIIDILIFSSPSNMRNIYGVRITLVQIWNFLWFDFGCLKLIVSNLGSYFVYFHILTSFRMNLIFYYDSSSKYHLFDIFLIQSVATFFNHVMSAIGGNAAGPG